jgi:hypothetical protein
VDEAFGEIEQPLFPVVDIPIEPADLVILGVGVVITLLRA